MLCPHDCCGAVVFFHSLVGNESLVAKLLGHGCTWIRRGVLNIRPIHIPASEFKISLDGFMSIVGISNNEAPHHIHLVSMQVVDGLQRSVSAACSVLAS